MPASELQRCTTAPGETPEGEGWTCIHAGCSYDRTQGRDGRYWLWQRIVHFATDEQIAHSFDAYR